MQELWLTVSQIVQAAVFGTLTLGFGYHLFNGWLGSLVEAVDALEASVGSIVIILQFFLIPAYFFRPLFALFIAAQFSWAVVRLSLKTNDLVYGSVGPPARGQVTNHSEMAHLFMLSAIWTGIRFVVPSVAAAAIYYLLLHFGVIIAIIASTLTFVLGTFIARGIYEDFFRSHKPSLRGGRQSHSLRRVNK